MKYSTEPGGRLARPARRAGQRGAAMVEAVIVVFTMLTIFFCLVWVSGLYRAKLIAVQDARYNAMWNATNNCQPKGTGYSGGRTTFEGDTAPVPPEASQLNNDLNFVRMVEEAGGVSRAQSRGSFRFGPMSGTVSSSSYALCNERADGINVFGEIGGYFQKAWGAFAHDVIDPLLGQL
jgi:hypothetical protein